MFTSLEQLLAAINPDIYQQLKRAVELGKWPNGSALTQEQRGLCLQAVIAYEDTHLPPEQRSGYIPPKSHDHCGSTGGNIADDITQPLKFQSS